MKHLIAALVVLVLLPSARAIAAAESVPLAKYSITSWTSKDGVPGIVGAVAQDRDGYLWIGTNEALIRFDGARFVRWEGPALAGSGVSVLTSDRDGSLWVGFIGNGALSRIRDGEVVNYECATGCRRATSTRLPRTTRERSGSAVEAACRDDAPASGSASR